MKIRIGTAGSPTGSNMTGIAVTEKAGLHAMEVQFGRGIQMGNDLAEKIGEERKKYSIGLSVHAPYYINLLSDKAEASRQRIIDSCDRAKRMGASPVVFHPGYYGKLSKQEAYEEAKRQISIILDKVKGWGVEIAPENTGKDTQFGTIEEVLGLANDLKTSFCMDIAHFRAKYRGKENLDDMFAMVPKKHVHFQYSGVEWNSGGEKQHLPIEKAHFTDFARKILERKTDCTIICESPDTFEDAQKMKKIFEDLGWEFEAQKRSKS
ncbi:MAG: TIM barrel protein [Candidatus Aenigmarchaeota archaeon]|nr:TIM barrel protein [Candidatus Aenigmarchaeota archaeon]